MSNSEVTLCEKYLYNKLRTYYPDIEVYNCFAPQSSTYPLITFQLTDSDEYKGANNYTFFTEFEVIIKVWDEDKYNDIIANTLNSIFENVQGEEFQDGYIQSIVKIETIPSMKDYYNGHDYYARIFKYLIKIKLN